MRLSAVIATSVVTLAMGAVTHAQLGSRKKHDPRVEVLLKKGDLKFEIDQDGDFKLVNQLDGGRTQAVFINTSTQNLGDMEIRDIWSVALVSDKPLNTEIANDLLRENNVVKLGAWRVQRSGNKTVVAFAAKIAADTDLETLLITLQAVTMTADKKEQELTEMDKL